MSSLCKTLTTDMKSDKVVTEAFDVYDHQTTHHTFWTKYKFIVLITGIENNSPGIKRDFYTNDDNSSIVSIVQLEMFIELADK